MMVRLGLAAVAAALAAAQTPTESNLAYQHFQAVRNSAEGVGAAASWVQVYERGPAGPRDIPPYLPVARVFIDLGVHVDEVPALLEKAVREMDAPGGFTDIRSRSNSPFEDSIGRAMAASMYARIGQPLKAHPLLDRVAEAIASIRPAELDPSKARIFNVALLFSYRDAVARAAIAEGRKEDALAAEYAILTNTQSIGPNLIAEHRSLALQLWSDLGRSPGGFESWLSGKH
jgi:hypothetical protein